MNFKSTAIMLLCLGATEAVRVTEMSGPATLAGNPVVVSATPGIPDARDVQLESLRKDSPVVANAEANVSNTANEGITDARHAQVSHKFNGVNSAAEKAQPEFMQDWKV